MKCERCGYAYEPIIVTIKDAIQTRTLCPNCLAIELQENHIELVNDMNVLDDIIGLPGAVTFKSGDEEYHLEHKTMMRLIARNLQPIEWICLTAKYSKNNYMLHEDFYDSNGYALQPIV